MNKLQFSIELCEFTTSGEAYLCGWASHPGGIDFVAFEADGNLFGRAALSQSSSDVTPDNSGCSQSARMSFSLYCAAIAPPAPPTRLLSGSMKVIAKVGLLTGACHALPVFYEVVEKLHTRSDTNDLIHFGVEQPTPLSGNGYVIEFNPAYFRLSGWARAAQGVKAVEILSEGLLLDTAHYGIRRSVIQSHPFASGDEIFCGFVASGPRSSLHSDTGIISLRVIDSAGNAKIADYAYQFRKPVVHHSHIPGYVSGPSAQSLMHFGSEASKLESVGLDIVLIVADIDDCVHTLQSICAHAVEDLRLFLVFEDILIDEALLFNKVPLLRTKSVSVISGLSHYITVLRDRRFAKPAMINRRFFTVLRSGDMYLESGLQAFEFAMQRNSLGELFYSDEWRFDEAAAGWEIFRKPKWSPQLFENHNYLGRSWFLRSSLLTSASSAIETIPTQHLHALLVLLMQSLSSDPIRLDEVLFWQGDQAGPTCCDELSALNVVGRLSMPTFYAESGLVGGSYRLRRNVPTSIMVSMIIPSIGALGLVKRCLESIKRLTPSIRYELILVTNLASAGNAEWACWLDSNADKVVFAPGAFNWSRLNNLASQEAVGDYLLFLNDDVEVLDTQWLPALLEYAVLPEVGAVGGKLLYPDGKIQHAGMFLGERLGTALHCYQYCHSDDRSYFGMAQVVRNVVSVTGACLLTRRKLFADMGGFDEQHPVINNDLDYCLRLHRSGLAVVYTPYAQLIHHEMASRRNATDDFSFARFEADWGNTYRDGDPYWSRFLRKDIEIPTVIRE